MTGLIDGTLDSVDESLVAARQAATAAAAAEEEPVWLPPGAVPPPPPAAGVSGASLSAPTGRRGRGGDGDDS